METEEKQIGYEFFTEQGIRTSEWFYNKGVKIGKPFNLGDLLERDLKRILPSKAGIYHLFYDDVLVYIGMSRNLQNRLVGHYKSKEMEFNNVLYFCASQGNKNINDIFRIERNMIKYYKPFYNESYLN